MDNRLPIVSAGSEVCLQQPVERRAWHYTHQWNTPPNVHTVKSTDKHAHICYNTHSNTTLHTFKQHICTHTHSNESQKKTGKEKKITSFSAESLNCCCCHMFLSFLKAKLWYAVPPRPEQLSGASLQQRRSTAAISQQPTVNQGGFLLGLKANAIFFFKGKKS